MATTTCLGCGGQIDLRHGVAPIGVIARGDRFMHEGCVIDSAAVARRRTVGVPAYLLRGGPSRDN
jgi:hypothetical protein